MDEEADVEVKEEVELLVDDEVVDDELEVEVTDEEVNEEEEIVEEAVRA